MILTLSDGNRKEDYDRAKALINDAAKSGSYLYPIKVCSHTFAVKPLSRDVVLTISPLVLGNLLLLEPSQPLEAPP